MNVRLLATIAALCTAGCGYYPFPYTAPLKYQSGCIKVTSDFALNQTSLDENVATERAILARRGIVSESDYCNSFADVPIAIRGRDYLGGDNGLGNFSRLSGVEVSNDATAMLHEHLHALDVAHGRFLTFRHSGWGGGFWSADQEFTFCAMDLWRDVPNAPAENCAYQRDQ